MCIFKDERCNAESIINKTYDQVETIKIEQEALKVKMNIVLGVMGVIGTAIAGVLVMLLLNK